MQFSVKVEYKHVTDGLNDAARRQVPFVAAKTLTALAGDASGHLVKKLPVAFDRPTLFTQRGVYTKRAEKTTLAAEVYFPQSQQERGRSLREYIQPGVSPSTYARMQKKTEYLLTRAGFLPAGWVTVPGRYIMDGKLDGHGNMPGSYYKQIVRNLYIKHIKGPPKPRSKASLARTARWGVDNEFFAVKPGANSLAKGGGWLPPGVYKREGAGGRTLRQYLKFVRKASYKRRLDVLGEVEIAVRFNLQRRWSESVQLITDKFKAH